MAHGWDVVPCWIHPIRCAVNVSPFSPNNISTGVFQMAGPSSICPKISLKSVSISFKPYAFRSRVILSYFDPTIWFIFCALEHSVWSMFWWMIKGNTSLHYLFVVKLKVCAGAEWMLCRCVRACFVASEKQVCSRDALGGTKAQTVWSNREI